MRVECEEEAGSAGSLAKSKSAQLSRPLDLFSLSSRPERQRLLLVRSGGIMTSLAARSVHEIKRAAKCAADLIRSL
jgi:hypothetical protein